MSWILPDDHTDVIVAARSIPFLLDLCPNEKKPPLLQISKFSLDPPPIAISFENRTIHRNLHYQTLPFIHAFSIEYP